MFQKMLRGRFLRHCVALVAMVATSLTFVPNAQAQPAVRHPSAGSTIQYVHDALGRLEAVIDPLNGTAVYHYDAVGNITSITRTAAGALSVIDFSPINGAPGTVITVYGTGFSTTAHSDAVSFDGTATTATSATATSLTVTVPAGATAGPVKVTVGSGSAQSTQDFNPTSLAPSIASIIPDVVTVGTSVTVSGTNFQTDASLDRVNFGNQLGTVSAASATSLSALVPTNAASGHVYVSTPYGEAIADVYVPPNGYTPSQVAYTSRTTLGTEQSVTVPPTGQIGLVLFDASVGQQVTASLTGNQTESMALYAPNGSLVTSTQPGTEPILDDVTLADSGTYMILLSGTSGGTGKLGVFLASPDLTATLAPGSASAPFTTTAPGQVIRVAVPISAGQRVSVEVSGGSFAAGCDLELVLLDPTGATVDGPLCAGKTAYFDAATFASAGTYSLLFAPAAVATGALTLSVFEVPPDATASLTVGGGAGQLSITTPGQNGQATFPATSGEKVTVSATSPFATCCSQIALLAPNGGLLKQTKLDPNATIGPLTLPSTGSYLLVVDPAGPQTGSVSLTVTSAGNAVFAPQPGRHLAPERVVRATALARRVSASAAALPLLTAPVGTTAISGRILDSRDGTPIAGVRVGIGSKSTTSRADGRFLLSGVPSGLQTAYINGDSDASHISYGTFKEAVRVTRGTTTPLPSTTWLTPLDLIHTLTVPSPAPSNLTLTTPAIPGLKILVPKGTVLRSPSGKIVTHLTVTAMPYNRTPIELPAGMPSFFTLQPAGTVVTGSAGLQIVYPNVAHFAPGDRVPYYSYDPAGWGGWWQYGHGTVSADGTEVVPSSSTHLTEIVPFGQTQQPPPPNGPKGPNGGDPVDLYTGLLTVSKVDLSLPDLMPIELEHSLRQNDPTSRAFGVGGDDNYDEYLTDSGTNVNLNFADGAEYLYTATGSNTWVEENDPGSYFHSVLTENGESWNISLADGTQYGFGLELTRLVYITDRNGNTITINRPDRTNIGTVVSPFGRTLTFTHDSLNRITSVTDNTGRTVSFTYDSDGRLSTVTDVSGGVTTYNYQGSTTDITSIVDPMGITYLTNTYDSNNRVATQTLADGSTYQFNYTTNGSGQVIATTETDPRGIETTTTFNSAGYPTAVEDAVGTPLEQTTSYVLDPASNEVTDEIDPLGRDTHFTYDSFGDVLTATQLYGTAQASTTTYTYDPTFHQLTSVTDPAGHTTSYSLDSHGNVLAVTDPLGHITSYTYNQFGEETSTTNPAGDTTRYTYEGGDPIATTDPTGHTTTRFIDAAGRIAGVTDPLGNTKVTIWDAANQVLSVTNTLGGTTSYTYDADGDLLTCTDANGHMTSYTYNSLQEKTGTTDPLGRTTTYAYDPDGNLVSTTDGRGLVTDYNYDDLNRVTFVGFNAQTSGGNTTYDSTVTATYDAASRLTSIDDSSYGTITQTFDGLDRLLTQTTPTSSISYTYDADGNRTGMAVSGQTPVSYTYTADNQVASITQGSLAAGFTYDAADRLIGETLPNNVTVTETYNADSLPSGLTYASGAGSLGSLTYTYDTGDQQSSLGGSLAATGLPAAVPSRTYDAANELTDNNGATLTYDDDGDLLSDGTNTYAWNSRGQLQSVTTGGQTTTYAYDPFDRRTSSTTAGLTTSYTYDLSNEILQQVGSSAPTRLLTGLALGQNLAATTSGTTSTFLLNPEDSTVGVVGSTGTIGTSYTYDPYGQTSVSGTSANTQQWIGRSDDPSGLYYDGARYYDPALEEFISIDPLALSSYEADAYTYADVDPVDETDQTGLQGDPADIANPNYNGPLPDTQGGGAALLNGRKLGAPPPHQNFFIDLATTLFTVGTNFVVGKIISPIINAALHAVTGVGNSP
jgi:RHS repeat-associated protein